MKYIETEMIRVNDEYGRLRFDCDLRLWQDKQLELETIERLHEELKANSLVKNCKTTFQGEA